MTNNFFKKIIFTFSLIIINYLALFSQAPFTHELLIYSSHVDVIGTHDGGYAISDYKEVPPNGFGGKSIMKIDSAGNILSDNVYNPTCYLLEGPSYPLHETSDSGFYLCAMAEDCGMGLANWWEIYKIDKYGNCLWGILDIDSNYYDSGRVVRDLRKDKFTDDFTVVGTTIAYDNMGDLAEWTSFVNKYDSSGTLIFSKQFDVLNSPHPIFSLDKCKGYYDAAGNLTEYLVQGSGNFVGPCLLNLSPSGNINWIKRYPGAPKFSDQTKLDSNYYLLAINYMEPISFLYKTDINVVPLFSIQIDSVKAYKIEKSDSNHLLIIGSLGELTKYPVIIEMDTSGNITKAKYNPSGIFSETSYGHPGLYYDENTKAIYINYKNAFNQKFIEKLYLDSSCNFIDTVLNAYAISTITDSAFLNPFIYHATNMIPVSPPYPVTDSINIGCNTTGISSQQPPASHLQIFPNPSTDFINISFTLPAKKNITVQLFNLYGQVLETRNVTSLSRGTHEIKMDISGLQQGIYFVKLNAGGKEEMRKIIKL